MNLELLDPFRRQIPDRVDATLNLPSVLHSRKKSDKNDPDDEDWKAANHVSFNRRGAYIAVGYGSGIVGVYDILSRTLSGVYRNSNGPTSAADAGGPSPSNVVSHGVTSVTWSRRSRTIVAGSAADAEVQVIDTTHPFGPEECCLGITEEDSKDNPDDERSTVHSSDTVQHNAPRDSSFAKPISVHDHHKKTRYLKIHVIPTTGQREDVTYPPVRHKPHVPVSTATNKRYPTIRFKLPGPVGGSLQAHPRETSAGLAVLMDGSLVVFWIPHYAWGDVDEEQQKQLPKGSPKVQVVTIYKSEKRTITCAAFDPHGEQIYAATKDGKLMGFQVSSIFSKFAKGRLSFTQLKPSFEIHIPGGATAWHLLVSRNGRSLVINSADAALRLYSTKECWTTPEEVERPTQVFQDLISKVKFASCDISGDAEFVVGGANGNENKYELYIWNTKTGALMDKLTGPTVELYSVAWHPTRSFLAVASSDGLVDIWGPRINWTAFAPDFQALPQNVEYVECEDEFDIDDGDKDGEMRVDGDQDEDKDVDVLTIEPVPVFASDSEDEEEIFYFETKVSRILGAVTQ